MIIADENKVLWINVIQSYIASQQEIDENYTYPLIGTGSQADPIQIASAFDLAYLSYVSRNGSTFLDNKYFEFTKDIEMNDGRFEVDENHEITYYDGGDGQLYEWRPIKRIRNSVIKGNGHKVTGLYFNNVLYSNDNSNAFIGLFSDTGRTKLVDGLNIENIYMVCQAYSPFGFSDKINNCNVLSGEIVFLHEEKMVEMNGIGSAKYEISFCNNYANIYAYKKTTAYNSAICGIGAAPIIKHCKNFGNITCVTGDYTSGIGRDSVGRYEYCENYGIISTHAYPNAWGGKVQGNGVVYFIGCKNYGKTIDTQNGYSSGALVGLTYSTCVFIDCEQHAKQKNLSFTYYTQGEASIEVINSKLYTVEGNSNVFCSREMKNVIIKDSEIIMSESGNETASVVQNFIYSGKTIGLNLQNLKVKINNENQRIKLTTYYLSANYMNVKNVLIEAKSELRSNVVLGGFNYKSLDGVVCKVENDISKSWFYGSDFSGFFVKWKTGYIGLKAFEDAGVYMFAIPNEEYLKGRGFTKKG